MSAFKKLKERKLAQWAVAYVAGSWAVLQVADLLSETYGWPTPVMRLLPVVLGIGFLGALVLAWYHGEKGAQRVSGPELVMMTGILVLAGAAVAFVGRGGSEPRGAGGATSPDSTDAVLTSAAEQGSIAVLPFMDMSPQHDQEYFSDGITEEILNVLAQLPELRVASRTSAFSFKGSKAPIDSIARELHVANVLEGSVRKAGDRVRITAQLIDAHTGYHRWSETYDRDLEDVFAVQDEISRAIVDQLQVTLDSARAGKRLAKEETSDPQAHNLLLEAQYFAHQQTREGVLRADSLIRHAIARDSTYARAWAALGTLYDSEIYLGYGSRADLAPKARAAVDRALRLDPELESAHYVKGLLASDLDWDFKAAEASFRRAIELNPGHANAHSMLGWLLMRLGHPEEAVAEAERATELDPVSAGAHNNLGGMYSSAGLAPKAIDAYRQALVYAPESPLVEANLAFAYAADGQPANAVRAAEKAMQGEPGSGFVLASAAYAYARAGRRDDALAVVQRMHRVPGMDPSMFAAVWAGLGEPDSVFAYLAAAVDQRSSVVIDGGRDPVFAPYRKDPRMKALFDRMGLPLPSEN